MGIFLWPAAIKNCSLMSLLGPSSLLLVPLNLLKFHKYCKAFDKTNTLALLFSLKHHAKLLYFCFIQRYPASVVQLQGDGDPASHSVGGLGSSPGRCTDLRHLPQDQICRRLWEPVFVLPDQILCPLWRASLPQI